MRPSSRSWALLGLMSMTTLSSFCARIRMVQSPTGRRPRPQPPARLAQPLFGGEEAVQQVLGLVGADVDDHAVVFLRQNPHGSVPHRRHPPRLLVEGVRRLAEVIAGVVISRRE